MLNDLYDIERGLAAFGVSVAAKHPDVNYMAKGGIIRVRLDAQGAIDDLDFIADSGNDAFWILRDGKHNGFPGLKTAQGLLALDASAQAVHDANWTSNRTTAGRRSELLRLIDVAHLDLSEEWPKVGHRKRIAERLKQLAPLRGSPNTAAVPAAFERFLLALEREPSFLAALLARLKERLDNSDESWLDLARGALTGQTALYIDVAEKDFPRNASDPRQIAPVSAALDGGSGSDGETKLGPCALTGETVRLHVGNFPQPNLGGVGPSILFSRNSDIPSLTRYGKSAAASFAVGADLLGRLDGALSHLTRPGLEHKTWRLIPAESGDKRDLLIAACPAAPGQAFVRAIASDSAFDDDEAPDFSAFMERTRQVIEQSAGKYNQAAAQAQVIILILRAVDKANRKAVYHRAVSAVAFFEAAKNWDTQATMNVPPWLGFHLPAIAKRKIEAGFKRPFRVRPLSLSPLSRKTFVGGGRRSVDSKGQPAAVALALFLRQGDTNRLARNVLHQLLERHGPMLTGLAHAGRKHGDHLKSFDPKWDLRLDALASITWIGVLLYLLGRTTEVYMSHPAFCLGQYLAAVDAVHVGYCADMRGGQVPPTLLGNSVFSIAGNQPARALSIVQGRWKPYGGWLNQERRIRGKIKQLEDGKDVQIAWDMRRALSAGRRIQPLLADLAGKIEERLAPDDIFRAELLLGYMAGLPPSKKNGEDGDVSEGDTKQGGKS